MMGYYLFCDNHALEFAYDEITEDKQKNLQRRVEIMKYRSELSNACTSGWHRNTCFHLEGGTYTKSFDMGENEWTMRLYYSLPQYLPKHVLLNCTCDKSSVFKDYHNTHTKSVVEFLLSWCT